MRLAAVGIPRSPQIGTESIPLEGGVSTSGLSVPRFRKVNAVHLARVPRLDF